jgi:cell division GTPase FtsZ
MINRILKTVGETAASLFAQPFPENEKNMKKAGSSLKRWKPAIFVSLYRYNLV